MARNLNNALMDVSVNCRDMLKRLSINNEEVVEQSPICKKILAHSPEADPLELGAHLLATHCPDSNPEDASISPGGQGNDGSLNSISSAGFTHAWRNIGSGVSSMGGIEPCFGGGVVVPGGGPGSGRCGGVGTESGGNRSAGLTMKEYDQHLARLNKENFALKLRIYFLEEKQGQTGQAAPQLHKANIELKVENESLKRQLFDKQQLLSQASSALVQLEEEYKEQLAALLREHETRVRDLQDNVLQLQKTADAYADRCQELESNLREQQQQISRKPDAGINELTHLCDLAFPTTEDAAADETATGNNCWSNAALWTNNSSDTAMLWGPPTTVPSAGLLAAGAPITTTDAVSTAGSQDTASHVQGKLSSESQNSQNGFSDNRGAPATADANSPIHVNTTNVTNNNINNTLPNTSNKLQQMQYHHPSQYQQQNASSKAYPEQHQQHYHYYQQQPVTNALVAAGATVNDASNVLATAQQLPNIGDSSAVVPAVVSSAVTPPSVQGVLSVGGHAEIDESGKQRMQELEQNIAQLSHKLQLLQEQLRHKDNITDALQEDLENLKKELQEKESDALEREEKVESLSQELETRHLQLRTKEDTIHNLHSDLDRVEPEISLKVQEIVERDRIIEEKIEQIDQQNKILVEIQITLDEKQKQIAELEASLAEARDRATQLEKDYNRSCGALNGFISDLSLRDKDIVNLKKEVKKRDRKIKDLVAELKETLDMLGKAKWEAETSGCGEDSVKEMVEEENENSEEKWAKVNSRSEAKFNSFHFSSAGETGDNLAANFVHERRIRKSRQHEDQYLQNIHSFSSEQEAAFFLSPRSRKKIQQHQNNEDSVSVQSAASNLESSILETTRSQKLKPRHVRNCKSSDNQDFNNCNKVPSLPPDKGSLTETRQASFHDGSHHSQQSCGSHKARGDSLATTKESSPCCLRKLNVVIETTTSTTKPKCTSSCTRSQQQQPHAQNKTEVLRSVSDDLVYGEKINNTVTNDNEFNNENFKYSDTPTNVETYHCRDISLCIKSVTKDTAPSIKQRYHFKAKERLTVNHALLHSERSGVSTSNIREQSNEERGSVFNDLLSTTGSNSLTEQLVPKSRARSPFHRGSRVYFKSEDCFNHPFAPPPSPSSPSYLLSQLRDTCSEPEQALGCSTPITDTYSDDNLLQYNSDTLHSVAVIRKVKKKQSKVLIPTNANRNLSTSKQKSKSPQNVDFKVCYCYPPEQCKCYTLSSSNLNYCKISDTSIHSKNILQIRNQYRNTEKQHSNASDGEVSNHRRSSSLHRDRCNGNVLCCNAGLYTEGVNTASRCSTLRSGHAGHAHTDLHNEKQSIVQTDAAANSRLSSSGNNFSQTAPCSKTSSGFVCLVSKAVHDCRE